jgi:hypothetical protein
VTIEEDAGLPSREVCVTITRVVIGVLVVGTIVLIGGLSIAYRRAADPYAAADVKCQAVGSSRGEAAYQRCVDEDIRSGPFGDVGAIWLTGVGTASLVVCGIWIALGRRWNRSASRVPKPQERAGAAGGPPSHEDRPPGFDGPGLPPHDR